MIVEGSNSDDGHYVQWSYVDLEQKTGIRKKSHEKAGNVQNSLILPSEIREKY